MSSRAVSFPTIARVRAVAITAALATLVTVISTSVLRAQEAFAAARHLEFGGGFDYAQPLSEFRQNVVRGMGGGGHALLGVDPAGILGLRVDLGLINYGNETLRFPLSSTFRRVTLREETSNNIFLGSIGPQLAVPSGPIRPYVNGGVGFGYFFTQTSLNGDDSQNANFATTTNYSDHSLIYTGGAGVYVPIHVRRETVSLDIGARYNAAGRARYLVKGDIVDDPSNSTGLLITPHETPARFITYRVGVAVRF